MFLCTLSRFHFFFFFSSRRRHTRCSRDWSSDVCSSDLVGIGGAGMQGIARLLLARGVQVSGSDLKESRGLDELRGSGAAVFVGHRAEQIDGNGVPDAVVISTAIPAGNGELVAARERGIPVWARA